MPRRNRSVHGKFIPPVKPEKVHQRRERVNTAQLAQALVDRGLADVAVVMGGSKGGRRDAGPGECDA